MSIYAISDLHLSFSAEKPMDIYGGEWINHTEKVKNHWIELVKEEDTVLLPGDTSWALRFHDAVVDLRWISKLPGRKILIKGNHDLWWNSLTKLNALFENMVFLQNNFYIAEQYAICGSRGWICPDDDNFTKQDDKIYQRELMRLRLSLEAAAKSGYGNKYAGEKGGILVMIHFPPASDTARISGFTQLFEEYGVEKVLYGHLHGKDAYSNGIQGIYNKIEYILTSVDFLRCKPYRIV